MHCLVVFKIFLIAFASPNCVACGLFVRHDQYDTHGKVNLWQSSYSYLPHRNFILQIKHYLCTLGYYCNHAVKIKSVELPDSSFKISASATVDIASTQLLLGNFRFTLLSR
jgi:hypothetical protein